LCAFIAVDIDGDGLVSQEEEIFAKTMAGKRILAKKFVDRQHQMGTSASTMWKYGQDFNGKSSRTCVDTIMYARDFQGLMNHLKFKERSIKLSSSDQMKNSLVAPVTQRQKVGSARIFVQEYQGLR
jgi:hypothetical protein